MKQVVIVRHGKSVPFGYDDDFSRDLRERGKKDAEKISRELHTKGIKPDTMISSPAKRAIKTARIFAENLDFNKNDIVQIKDIYDGLTTHEFLGLINNLPEKTETAFFFGHNPGFYYFVNNLLGNFDGDMPTCSTVAIYFDVDSWGEIEARTGKLVIQLVPRMFK
jgi:phosphohistidine phosphatase